MIKPLLAILGTVFLGLGILGIFIPGLPTTPFILLSAGLYARSSERLYGRLLNNKIIGPRITEYRRNKGLTLREKYSSILLMWTMIFITLLFGLQALVPKIVVAVVGMIGTFYMAFLLPTKQKTSGSYKT